MRWLGRLRFAPADREDGEAFGFFTLSMTLRMMSSSGISIPEGIVVVG